MVCKEVSVLSKLPKNGHGSKCSRFTGPVASFPKAVRENPRLRGSHKTPPAEEAAGEDHEHVLVLLLKTLHLAISTRQRVKGLRSRSQVRLKTPLRGPHVEYHWWSGGRGVGAAKTYRRTFVMTQPSLGSPSGSSLSGACSEGAGAGAKAPSRRLTSRCRACSASDRKSVV